MVKVKCLENGIIYDSIIECSKELNVDRRSIFRQLRGEIDKVKGFTFERV